MPCQCGSTATAANPADATYGGCECGTDTGSSESCECGSTPTPSDRATDRERSLERVVMELDRRVRKLEASR